MLQSAISFAFTSSGEDGFVEAASRCNLEVAGINHPPIQRSNLAFDGHYLS